MFYQLLIKLELADIIEGWLRMYTYNRYIVFNFLDTQRLLCNHHIHLDIYEHGMEEMAKSRTQRQLPDKTRILRLQLLTLHDELTEFSDQCSFLCDAFACIPAQEEVIDAETIRGVSYFAHWMKGRIRKMKTDLIAVRDQANALK